MKRTKFMIGHKMTTAGLLLLLGVACTAHAAESPQIPTYGPGRTRLIYSGKTSETRPIDEDLAGNWGPLSPNELALSVRFKARTFKLGAPVPVIVLLRNLSTNEWSVPPESKPSFVVTYQGTETLRPEPGPPLRTGSALGTERLLAGSQLRYVERLDQRFQLNRPGQYVVSATMAVGQKVSSGAAVIDIVDEPVAQQAEEPEPRGAHSAEELLPDGNKGPSAGLQRLTVPSDVREAAEKQQQQLAQIRERARMRDDSPNKALQLPAPADESSAPSNGPAPTPQGRQSSAVRAIVYSVIVVALTGGLGLLLWRLRHKNQIG